MKLKLEILCISDKGEHDTERVILRARKDCNLGFFLLCLSTWKSKATISNKLRHLFWFPEAAVNSGDFIILYTRKGSTIGCENQLGTTTHAFYWGLEKPVWNDPKDCAVVFESFGWVSRGAG
jgi:hypothetical protein